jgi:hypothetical protein
MMSQLILTEHAQIRYIELLTKIHKLNLMCIILMHGVTGDIEAPATSSQ